jgi:alkylation response protein AidB-like acyl-CoA dehydrogenase
MDISLTDDQSLIAETARDFAREVMPPARVRELEASEHGFDPTVWRRMAEMGWAGAIFPEEYGGAGLGLFELGLIAEALGGGAVPSPLFSTVVEAGALLLEAGSDAQRKAWLPRIAAGDAILTSALLEPSGQLAPEAMRVQATRAGNGYAIGGTKLFVRDAGTAEGIAVLARTGPAPHDLTFLLVPAGTPGVTKRRLLAAGGEALWEVAFDDARVDADAVIGTPGGAWPHAESLVRRGAALKAAEMVGMGQASLDMTLAYAKTRHQFGVPIGSFQGVQHHCAEMLRDLQVCRLLTWQACARLAAGLPAEREVAMAKAKCGVAIPALTRTAHQIHGAIAYYRDYPLELHYHRAIAAQAAYGDALHHRSALARMMREDLDRFRGDGRHELPVHQG